MICGTANFAHMDDDPTTTSPTTPKASKKRNRNPYATMGLDKFSMVLAELESKKEMILQRAGAQGVSLIRFMTDSSQHWVPIVVRPKEVKDEREMKIVHDEKKEEVKDVEKRLKIEEKKTTTTTTTTTMTMTTKSKKKKKNKSWRWRVGCYWGLVMVFILLCLVMFGRVFAICCTSIWWYTMPSIKDLNDVFNEKMGMMKKKEKKKEIARRLSDKRLGGKLGGVQSFKKKGVVKS